MNCIGLLLFYFGPAPLVVWRSPNSTHIQTIFFRAPGAAVLNTAAPVLVGSCQGPTPQRRATSVRASASTPSTSSSRRASASRPSPTWTRTRRSLPPRWQRRAELRRPKTLARKLARKPRVVRSPGPRLRHDNHDFAQRLSYSSWRRNQIPVSLRPLGARSSHWYMPQRPSSPRAYAE